MRHRILVSVLVAPVVLLAAAAAPASAGPRVGTATAGLAPLNQEGQGLVTLEQMGTNLTLHLAADQLVDGVHLAHIHGARQGENVCPTLADDSDGNGLVDLAEGIPAYGTVQVTLSNGTNDRGTSLDYTRTFTHLDSGDAVASLGDIDEYTIVVHGVDLTGDGVASNPDVDGDGPDHDDNEITMPALCGTIER